MPLQEGGWGLHEVLKVNNWKLRGIVNGIDNKEWSPTYDEYLKVRRATWPGAGPCWEPACCPLPAPLVGMQLGTLG